MTEPTLITLKDVALTANPGEPINYSPYGFIIDEHARVHALVHRWHHGVITALLYPELAKKNGYEPPSGPIEDLEIYRYEQFAHEVAHELPIIRISTTPPFWVVFISAKDSCRQPMSKLKPFV